MGVHNKNSDVSQIKLRDNLNGRSEFEEDTHASTMALLPSDTNVLESEGLLGNFSQRVSTQLMIVKPSVLMMDQFDINSPQYVNKKIYDQLHQSIVSSDLSVRARERALELIESVYVILINPQKQESELIEFLEQEYDILKKITSMKLSDSEEVFDKLRSVVNQILNECEIKESGWMNEEDSEMGEAEDAVECDDESESEESEDEEGEEDEEDEEDDEENEEEENAEEDAELEEDSDEESVEELEGVEEENDVEEADEIELGESDDESDDHEVENEDMDEEELEEPDENEEAESDEEEIEEPDEDEEEETSEEELEESDEDATCEEEGPELEEAEKDESEEFEADGEDDNDESEEVESLDEDAEIDDDMDHKDDEESECEDDSEDTWSSAEEPDDQHMPGDVLTNAFDTLLKKKTVSQLCIREHDEKDISRGVENNNLL